MFKRSSRTFGGLEESEFHTLASYNGEVARGIVHTDDWKQQMAELQRRYREGTQHG